MAHCPTCGDDFERPGLHWWHGSCPYPSLTEEQRQTVEGLLMGDGSIPKPSGGDNCVFRIPVINRRFLSWFDEYMGILTTGVRLKKTASQLAKNNRATGFSPNAVTENYHDVHTVWSRTNPYFNDTRARWYTEEGKRFPDNIELTPTLAKFWYASDGYLDVGRWGRPRAEIKCTNERDRSEFLINLFEEHGLSPQYRRHELRFTCDDTERLVEWMGNPVPGFEYKWELGSIERYHELKEQAYTEYTTQTFED